MLASPTDADLANSNAGSNPIDIKEIKGGGMRLFTDSQVNKVQERMSSTIEEGSNHIQGSVYPSIRKNNEHASARDLNDHILANSQD